VGKNQKKRRGARGKLGPYWTAGKAIRKGLDKEEGTPKKKKKDQLKKQKTENPPTSGKQPSNPKKGEKEGGQKSKREKF